MSGLVAWRPFNELERWRREMDRQMSDMFHDVEWDHTPTARAPSIESFVKDGNLVIRADVPGLETKDVDITVLDNVLTIKGERKEEKEVKKEHYIRREVAYGTFERRLTLPEGTDAGKIKASFKNGVIELTMPTGKEVAARKIQIDAGAESKAQAQK